MKRYPLIDLAVKRAIFEAQQAVVRALIDSVLMRSYPATVKLTGPQ